MKKKKLIYILDWLRVNCEYIFSKFQLKDSRSIMSFNHKLWKVKCLLCRTESNLLCCEQGAHFLCWAWVHKPSLNPGLRACTLWWVGEVSISRAKWAVKQHTTVRLRARAHLTWMSNLSASFICMSSTEPERERERERESCPRWCCEPKTAANPVTHPYCLNSERIQPQSCSFKRSP